MLPTIIIDRDNYDDETIYVSATKERIKNAPELDETTYRAPYPRPPQPGWQPTWATVVPRSQPTVEAALYPIRLIRRAGTSP
jgi:hypothetical protein